VTEISPLNADLHCHSVVSDGTLEPEALVERAHRNGVQMLALTDHDEIGGLAQAEAAATARGIRFVPGVEVSVTWGHQTIHVVGLRIDYRDPRLLEGLQRTRGGREQRAREIAAQLENAGIAGAYEGALQYVGNPDLISRSHFARYLVEIGACADVSQVFERYLVEGRPGYVAHRWARLGDAVRWIRDAGGDAVLAHPGRYKLSAGGLWSLMAEFAEAGGTGIEVVSGSHTPEQYRTFAQHAVDFGFRASRGSDFHDPKESRVDLGRLPPLPWSVVPIWHGWEDRSE